MRFGIRRALAAGAFGLASVIHPLAALAAAPLDGKVFLVDSGPAGKPVSEKDDVLTFRDGRFHSSLCDKYGFGTGAYEATARGAAMVFTTETTSDKDGRLVWKGKIEGGAIEGTFVHYRKPWFLNPNPEPREHWFKGRLKE